MKASDKGREGLSSLQRVRPSRQKDTFQDQFARRIFLRFHSFVVAAKRQPRISTSIFSAASYGWDEMIVACSAELHHGATIKLRCAGLPQSFNQHCIVCNTTCGFLTKSDSAVSAQSAQSKKIEHRHFIRDVHGSLNGQCGGKLVVCCISLMLWVFPGSFRCT